MFPTRLLILHLLVTSYFIVKTERRIIPAWDLPRASLLSFLPGEVCSHPHSLRRGWRLCLPAGGNFFPPQRRKGTLCFINTLQRCHAIKNTWTSCGTKLNTYGLWLLGISNSYRNITAMHYWWSVAFHCLRVRTPLPLLPSSHAAPFTQRLNSLIKLWLTVYTILTVTDLVLETVPLHMNTVLSERGPGSQDTLTLGVSAAHRMCTSVQVGLDSTCFEFSWTNSHPFSLLCFGKLRHLPCSVSGHVAAHRFPPCPGCRASCVTKCCTCHAAAHTLSLYVSLAALGKCYT